MNVLLRTAEQVVIVERRQFALCDGSAPYDDHPWQLPDRDPRDGISANNDGVTVASTVPTHDALVRFEVWTGEPTKSDDLSIGEVSVPLPTGTLTGWAIPHGPAGDPIELVGPGIYAVRVFRQGGGEEARIRIEEGMFSGLESYSVQVWRTLQL
ncbi:hypothetical protein [Streptomyces sp. NBC_01518]|uniref:hypothetical protein n=1 Tax=Streptomyces sp. NBC_01518 TaxID=2903891 RepID=UPI003866FE4D